MHVAVLMAGANPFRALASKSLSDAVGLRTINPAMATLPEEFRQAGHQPLQLAHLVSNRELAHRVT